MGPGDKDNIRANHTEQALIRSETLYRTLFEGVINPITLMDRDGVVIMINKTGAKNLSLTPDECVGKSIFDLVPDIDDTFHEIYRQVIDTGVEVTKEYFVEFSSGPRWFWSVHQPVQDENSGRYALLVISYDITERKRAEEEKAALQDQLQQSQKMEAIGRLAGGVAHDFNNLLTGIMGYTSLMQVNLEPDDPHAETTGKIITICNRARDLTMNLLGFARKGKFHMQRLDLNELIREVKDILKQTISKRITIKTLRTKNLSSIEGDTGQISQILMNLCINAADAMGNAGTLTIAARDAVIEQDQHADLEPGHYVELSVADTGCGMDPENIARAFESFFTTKDQGKGTGLGLSMVYGTVKSHGGTVKLDSELRQGTTVTILFPALDSDSDVATPEAEKQKAMTIGQGTILVVDDEELVRTTTARLLEKMGYKVLQAVDGEDAVRAYKEKSDEITLVLLDMAMPVMDGADTFHELKGIDPEVRVLIFSGYSAGATTNGLMDEGAVGFIQKPFLPDKLADAVAKALAS